MGKPLSGWTANELRKRHKLPEREGADFNRTLDIDEYHKTLVEIEGEMAGRPKPLYSDAQVAQRNDE